MFTAFHVNQSWANSKTHKLDKQAEQPISCAEGENSTKNWKFEHDSIRWDFHVGSWRNMFQSNVRCISWDLDENVWLQSRMDELVSWSSMKEKFWSFVKKCFELRKQVKVDEKFEFSYLEKFSHLKNLDGIEKNWKIKVKSSFLSKTQVGSHS